MAENQQSDGNKEGNGDYIIRYIRHSSSSSSSSSSPSTSRPNWSPQNPYPVHVSNLMSQMRDAERRRISMTPGIPISPERVRSTLRRYNVRYPTFRSNNLRYSASQSNTAHSQRLTDDEIPGSSGSNGENNAQVAEEQVVAGPSGNASDSSESEARSNLKRPGSEEPENQKKTKVSETIFDDSTDEEDLNVIRTTEIAAAAAAAAAVAEPVHTVSSDFGVVLGSVFVQGDRTDRVGSTGNIPNAGYSRGLPELLQLGPDDTLPHIIRNTSMREGRLRRPLSEPSFLTANPVDIELQAIEAIQNFEDYVQDVLEVRGVDYLRNDRPLAIENIFLFTMRSIFPVFVLHPHLILEFQGRAAEFDTSCIMSTLSRLNPARKVLPHEVRDKCIICLAEFELQQNMRSLICEHKFHVSCIDTWCKTALTCPVCRRGIDGKTINQREPTSGSALATLRGLEFVRAFLIRNRYGANDDDSESEGGTDTSHN